jgi:hypothetical protein
MFGPTTTSCPLPTSNPARTPQRRRPLGTAGATLALALTCTGSLQALSVRQMDIHDLCSRAGHIVRGEVVEVRRGTVEAGGGTLSTVTYRLKIKEAFAGQTYGFFEFTGLAPSKSDTATPPGQPRRRPPIELPELKSGQEYLLFTTQPSRIGLSSVVGLGQGCFSIESKGGQETAVNERGNVGLGLPRTGPVAYEELAAEIRRVLAK